MVYTDLYNLHNTTGLKKRIRVIDSTNPIQKQFISFENLEYKPFFKSVNQYNKINNTALRDYRYWSLERSKKKHNEHLLKEPNHVYNNIQIGTVLENTNTKDLHSILLSTSITTFKKKSYIGVAGCFIMIVQEEDSLSYIDKETSTLKNYEDTDVLFCLMVKNGYDEYINLAIGLNEGIDTDILEFWVDSKFKEKKKSVFSKYKTIVNSFIKNHIEEMDIKVVYKENLNDYLYKKPLKIEARTVSEYNNKLKEICINIAKTI